MSLKTTLFAPALLLVFWPLAAMAGPREDSRAGIARCDQIVDDRGWLDCVYGAVQPMRARLGLAPAPDFQQRLVPGTAQAMRAALPRPVAMAPAAPVRKSDETLVHLAAYTFDRVACLPLPCRTERCGSSKRMM